VDDNEPRLDELPSGTVTFLFTDIEGSTRLERDLRERYSDVLSEHQQLLREAFALVDQAPWVPLYTPRTPYFVSKRVGNWQYHAYFHVLLDQLWVR
jgi:class 3 adenylate cyclase